MKSLTSVWFALVASHHDAAVTKAAAPTTLTLTSQVEQGQHLFGENCAECHGDGGMETDKGPPVVGKDAFPLRPRAGAKRDVDVHTAADIFAWATKHMPADAPGSLSTDEYLAIFAFDLTASFQVVRSSCQIGP